ncbi:MAG: SDR family NAD(P)-dependent oxidoreductase, partial [Nevskiales bacterium]
MSFKGKVVMITGAAGSLGKAVAAAFAEAGASLVLLDLNEAALQKVYPGSDAHRLLLTADLTKASSVAEAVETAMKRFDRIDALCNIAGGFRMG